MGGIGHALLKAMTWQPPGSPGWAREQESKRQDSEQQIREQQEQRAARESDHALHQHLIDMGAKPVVNGLVKDTVGPIQGEGVENDGLPFDMPGGTFVRKADPSLLHKFRDSDKNEVAYELPSPTQQLLAQMSAQNDPQVMAQARQGAMAKARNESDIQRFMRQSGGTNVSDLLSPEEIGKLGFRQDAPLRLMPNEAVGLLQKSVAPTIGAQSREAIADKNNDTKKGIANQANQTRLTLGGNALKSREQLAADRLDFQRQNAERDQQLRDAISARQSAVQMGSSPNLAPIKLKQFSEGVQQAQSLHSQADELNKKILDAQELLDPEQVPDGTRFRDPFSGATKTMNEFWRGSIEEMAAAKKELANALAGAAQRNYKDLGVVPGAATPSAQAPTASGGPTLPPSGAPAAGAGTPSSPAAPKGTPLAPALESRAQAIANYQQPGITGSRGGQMSAIMGRVMQLNPDYQQTQYDIFKDTEKNATNGKIATSANALNTMMGHLSVLNDAVDALKNGNVQVLNRLANAVGAQTGSTPQTTFQTIVHRLGPEVTTAYLSAGGSVGERGTNEADFSPNLSPEQLKQNIAVSALLADSKIKALQDQYQRGTYGRGKQKLLTEEAETARKKLASGAGAGAKTATKAHVAEYAKQKGVSIEQAMREFSQSGYAVQ